MYNWINWPTSFAINSTGEVVVIEWRGNLLKINRKDKEKILVNSVPVINMVNSLAIDKEDNIYCAGAVTNKIMRYSKNGYNVQVYEVEQVEGPGHECVAVDGDEVLLCECKNSGAIMVYHRNMKYKRRIKYGSGKIKGVACTDNAIYAYNLDKQEIEVFHKDGVFLKSFDCLSNGVKMLTNSLSIAVSGPFIYVANLDGDNVSVFSTERCDYVASIGCHGNQRGQFNCPACVCLDSDNFIYVADCLNKRVQCF